MLWRCCSAPRMRSYCTTCCSWCRPCAMKPPLTPASPPSWLSGPPGTQLWAPFCTGQSPPPPLPNPPCLTAAHACMYCYVRSVQQNTVMGTLLHRLGPHLPPSHLPPPRTLNHCCTYLHVLLCADSTGKIVSWGPPALVRLPLHPASLLHICLYALLRNNENGSQYKRGNPITENEPVMVTSNRQLPVFASLAFAMIDV